MIGKSLGRFRIEEKLGEGGMGVVWRAYDPQLERDVALKVLPDALVTDPEARARMLREARAVAALNDPHVLTVYDVGEADGHVYIATEYLPGRPLSELIGDKGLPVPEALRLAQQIAAGLAHAHARGVIHRDVKPSNVLVTPGGDAKLLDFGLAGQADPNLTATRKQPPLVWGTPAAMAPEIWHGARPDTRSDVWSLGALIYNLLAGHSPFPMGAPQDQTQAPPLPEAVPPALRAVVARCLEHEPERRYRSAAEVQAALDAIAVTSSSIPIPAEAARPRARNRTAVLAAAALVLLATAVVLLRPHPAKAQRITSLAVLPLENFSHDPDQQYFADAMTEELITRLAQLGVVRVISRTSSMRFRETTLPLPDIARQLGVDGIVEGSVQEVGGRVKISAQLMRAATDENLWAKSYEREMGDALALQDEVAAAIAQEVGGALAQPARPPSASSKPSANHAEVVQAYLRGRDQYWLWTAEGSERAIRYFDQALAMDSTFTPALAARGTALLFLSATPDSIALGRADIERALAQDPGNGEAHSARAELLYDHDWNWPEAEREFQRAIELNPNDAEAHHQYSHLLGTLGRMKESLDQAVIMMSLDPLAPASHMHLGWYEYEIGQFDSSRVASRKAIELDPGYVAAYAQLADIERVTHHWPAYRQAIQRAGQPLDPLLMPLVDAVEAGRNDDARRILGRILLPSDKYPWSLTEIAWWYSAIGERDRAFAALDSAYVRRDYFVKGINLDPGFANLRSDPRYAALRRRMRLPL